MLEATTIDIGEEELLSFSEAAAYICSRFARGGRAIHVSTLHRWSGRGIRGVRLKTVSIGGLRVTSKQALARFFDALSNSESSSAPAGSSASAAPSMAARDRRAAAADRELEEAGI